MASRYIYVLKIEVSAGFSSKYCQRIQLGEANNNARYEQWHNFAELPQVTLSFLGHVHTLLLTFLPKHWSIILQPFRASLFPLDKTYQSKLVYS